MEKSLSTRKKCEEKLIAFVNILKEFLFFRGRWMFGFYDKFSWNKFCVFKYKSSKSFLKSFLLGKLVEKVSKTDSLCEILCSPAFSCRFTSERFTLWIINWRWAQPQETFSTKDGIFFASQFASQSGNWRNQKQQNDSAEFILIKATRKTLCWEKYFPMLLCSCSNFYQ